MEQQQFTTRLDLSPFDQVGPRLYVHKFFCFEFPDPSRQPEAVEHLEQSLSATILRWPFITGYVGPAKHGAEHGLLEVRYTTPVVGEVESDILVVKNVPHEEFPWTYQQLAEAGMPPSVMDPKVLSTVPGEPDPENTYPALAIQANFVRGGLILCFAFHHAVADGGSFIAFIKAFGGAFANRARADSGVDTIAHKRLGYTFASGHDLRPLSSFPEYDPGSTPVRPPSSAPITTRILQFSAGNVRKLEEAVNQHLKIAIGPQASATNIGCLSSLIWVAVIRARRARLNPEETAKIGVAVNVRAVTDPPLPEDYFGNAFLHTIATMTVSELLGCDMSANIDGIISEVPVAVAALAAWRMRRAVKLDNKYVSDRLKTFSSLPDPTEVFSAYHRAMDTSNTGIDFSSWRDQGADVEFGIPGTNTSTVGFWRKAWAPNEGAYNILPRKGGSKGEADWEVSLGLSIEDMDRVCSKDELGSWMSRVLE